MVCARGRRAHLRIGRAREHIVSLEEYCASRTDRLSGRVPSRADRRHEPHSLDETQQVRARARARDNNSSDTDERRRRSRAV
jgi:hypothetical protein